MQEKIDFEEIMNTFNSICTNLPSIKKLTEGRKKRIEIFINEYPNVNILDFFNKVNNSDFLSNKNNNNKRGWKANFDFIFKPANVLKILEGNYDNYKYVDKKSKSKNINDIQKKAYKKANKEKDPDDLDLSSESLIKNSEFKELLDK